MRSRRFLQIILALAVSGGAPAALGVTQYKAKRKPFLFDVTTFTTTVSLPVTDTTEIVRMSDKAIEQRLTESPTDSTIEPLSLLMTNDEAQIAEMAEKLAIDGKADELKDYLKKYLVTAKPLKKGSAVKTVEFDAAGFALVDRDAFAEMYSKTHHRLVLDGKALWKDKPVRRELMKQLSPFFKKAERKALLERIKKGESIEVDEALLPDFAHKMVRRYIVHRGPNCFHAALAFHGAKMTSSSMINVKEETGYHRAMINYDELWRVLNRNFYEVDPDKQPLKYGDMLVFFDVPTETADDLTTPVDYRWIRHTATYLFGGYTFSKGSKSPNTPYTVRTLSDEWKTWKRFTSNLGVKVFRRSQKSVKLQPPMDLVDWIY